MVGASVAALGARIGHAATPAISGTLAEFDYSQVRLTGGPLKQHYDRIHACYLALDNDRLLKVYRQRAGLAAPGADMGGWYDADGFVPGPFAGAIHLRPGAHWQLDGRRSAATPKRANW